MIQANASCHIVLHWCRLHSMMLVWAWLCAVLWCTRQAAAAGAATSSDWFYEDLGERAGNGARPLPAQPYLASALRWAAIPLVVAAALRLHPSRAVSFSKSAGAEDYLLYHTLWWHATRFHGLTDAGNSSIQTDMSYNLELTALPVLDARKHCKNIKVRAVHSVNICSTVCRPRPCCGLSVSPAVCSAEFCRTCRSPFSCARGWRTGQRVCRLMCQRPPKGSACVRLAKGHQKEAPACG